MSGGTGSNRLIGGAGNDTFVFEDGDFGHDTITDFEVGNLDEKLDFSAFATSAGEFQVAFASTPGGTTRITFPTSGAYVDLQNAYFASEADFWVQVILG